MTYPFQVVDAFTTTPGKGNPAAVVLLDGHVDDRWMQTVAAEFNLSETAFVGPPDADGARPLRWFTPTVEVDLCGHATLASASVLLAADPAADVVAFETRSGVLTCRRADGDAIAMELPADPSDAPVDEDRVAAAIGVPVTRAGEGRGYVVAEVDGAATVAGIEPELDLVASVAGHGLVVTARGDGEVDVVCRMFAPASGIDEDPVTGSAWCALAPWWLERLGPRLRGRQVSARGGDLEVELRGDRVVLVGRAVAVSRGELLI